MWTHRRFTWHYVCDSPSQATLLSEQVRQVLQAAMDDTPQFFRDATINGVSLGVLEFEMTISDRDQWWVGRRARFLAEQLRRRTDLPLNLVDEQRVKLAPHVNRGKFRLRRLRREATSG